MKTKYIPKWGIEVKRAIAGRAEMQDIADGIGKSREYVSKVVNGRIISDGIKEEIINYVAANYGMVITPDMFEQHTA